MDMNQYLDMFIEEAKEHLQAINNNMLLFEQDMQNINLVNEIFRSAHTLKGMAATMGYEDLASLTHEMENVLDGIRNHKIKINVHGMDVLFKSVDALEEMVNSIIHAGDGKKDVIHIVEQLNAIAKGEFVTSEQATKVQATATSQEAVQHHNLQLDDFELTVLQQSSEGGYLPMHIKVTIRPDCVLKSARAYMVFDLLEKHGEVIKAKPSVEELEEEKFDLEFELVYVTKEDPAFIQSVIEKVSEIGQVEVNPFQPAAVSLAVAEVAATAVVERTEQAPQQAIATAEENNNGQELEQTQRNANRTIRVSIERLDVLMNLFSELVIDRGRLDQIAREIGKAELLETVEHMNRISSDLQSLILTMRMVPIEQVFNRFPRMVRGLARDLGKKVNLNIEGAETELDRTVIDEIGDPLVHLLRNALDHGLETTDERVQAGKNEQGTITLKAFHSGNQVFIDIQDDGRGINRDKVLQKAISKGIVSKERSTELTDHEVHQLLFASGFSTAEVVSDISGRGVGLDVVKNKIESLGGAVSVYSELGKGTTFSIQLPLTMSIIASMLVQVSDEKFAIPLTSIIETAVYRKSQIMSAHRQKVIDFRGKVVPLVDLKQVLDIEHGSAEDDQAISLVIVRKGDKMAALVVDSFIGQQEVVLKSLGNYLVNVFAISGATILGDGQVALILDCNALIK